MIVEIINVYEFRDNNDYILQPGDAFSAARSCCAFHQMNIELCIFWQNNNNNNDSIKILWCIKGGKEQKVRALYEIPIFKYSKAFSVSAIAKYACERKNKIPTKKKKVKVTRQRDSTWLRR